MIFKCPNLPGWSTSPRVKPALQLIGPFSPEQIAPSHIASQPSITEAFNGVDQSEWKPYKRHDSNSHLRFSYRNRGEENTKRGKERREERRKKSKQEGEEERKKKSNYAGADPGYVHLRRSPPDQIQNLPKSGMQPWLFIPFGKRFAPPYIEKKTVSEVFSTPAVVFERDHLFVGPCSLSVGSQDGIKFLRDWVL